MNKFLLAIPVVIVAAAGGTYYLANDKAAVQVDVLIEQALATGNYQQIVYEDVSIAVNGAATLTNLHIIDIQDNDYIIQQIVISNYDFLNEIPEYMSIEIQGLEFPSGLPAFDDSPAGNPEFDAYLSTLMTDNSIPVTMNYQYTYTPDDSDLIISNVSMGLENAGNIAFNSTMKNIPLTSFFDSSSMSSEDAQRQLMSYLAVAEIPQLSIEVDDAGILNSILEVRAEQNGLTVESARQRLIDQVSSLPVFAPVAIQAQAQDISDQLTSFLAGNKTLSLSLTPEYEGNIQRLQPEIMAAAFSGDFGKILDLLDLKISSQ